MDLSISQDRILELAEEICADAVLRVLGIEATPKVISEKRLWIDIGNLKHSGQTDRLYLAGPHAIIADLKSLRGEVAEAPTNMQLRDEAVLTFHNYPKIQKISVFICQPLVTRVPIICLYTRADHYLKAFEDLAERVYNSHDPKAKRIPGTVQCLYCRARGVCKPAIAWMKAMPLQRAPSLAASVERLTPVQLKEIWEKSGTIESILQEVERRLKILPPADLATLGLRMNNGHMRISKVTKPNVLFQRMSKLGVTVEEFTNIARIPKGAISDLIRKKTGYIRTKLDQTVDDVLAGITEEKRTQSSLEKI